MRRCIRILAPGGPLVLVVLVVCPLKE